jgi:hypothetical protein
MPGAAPTRAADAQVDADGQAGRRDHHRGRRVTGSMTVPTMHLRPIVAQPAPKAGARLRRRAAGGVMTASPAAAGDATYWHELAATFPVERFPLT